MNHICLRKARRDDCFSHNLSFRFFKKLKKVEFDYMHYICFFFFQFLFINLI